MVVAIGGATSSPSASASTVPSVIMGGGEGNKVVSIVSSEGAHVMTFLAPVSYNTMLVAGSRLESNTAYTVYSGGSVTNGTDFHGLYTAGEYTLGSGSGTFTTSNRVTVLGGNVSRG